MTKYTINVDWLEGILSGYVLTDRDCITHNLPNGEQLSIYKEKGGTKLFRSSFSLYINAKPFMQLFCDPHERSIIAPDHMQIQIKNEQFYRIGWLNSFKLILQRFSWTVASISRLDVALDGHNFIAVANKVQRGQIVCVSRALRAPIYNSKQELIEFRLGNYGSDRCLKVYNKSQELKVSHKHYIKALWEKAGLDTSKDVERLEVTLRHQFLKSVSEFDWRELDNFEFLASLMRTGLRKYWEFRQPTKKKNVTRCKKFDFIQWSHIGGTLLDRLQVIPANEVSRMRQAAKTLYMTFKATNEKWRFEACLEMLKNVNSLAWFYHVFEKWDNEFDRKTGKNRTGEIHWKYISDFKEYKNGEQLFMSIVDYTN